MNQAQHFISEQEYLQGEMIAEIRQQYIDGEVLFAMEGASHNHQRLISNLYAALNQYLPDKPYDLFVSELIVKTAPRFLYPDVMMICDDAQGDALRLESVGLSVSVAELYHRVDNEDMRDFLQQT